MAEARATFDADGAALLLVRGDWLELTAIDGLDAESTAGWRWSRSRHGAPAPRRRGPGGRCTCRRRRSCWSASPGSRRAGARRAPAGRLGRAARRAAGRLQGPAQARRRRARPADALATQSAIALARAQLYEREHTSRRRCRPRCSRARCRRSRALDLAAALQAGAPGLEVGGDFYDAFAIARGRVGRRDRRRVRQGRRRRRADRARPPHGARRGRRGRDRRADVLRALNRAVLAEGRPGAVPDRDLRAADAAAGGRLRADGGLRRAPAAGAARRRRDGRAARVPRARCWACSTTRIVPTRGRCWSPATRSCSTRTGSPRRARRTARSRTEDVAELLAARTRRHAAETARAASPPRALAGGGEHPRRHRGTRRQASRARPQGELRRTNLRHGDNDGLTRRARDCSSMLFDRGGSMRRTRWATGVGAGLLATTGCTRGSARGRQDARHWSTPGKLPDRGRASTRSGCWSPASS